MLERGREQKKKSNISELHSNVCGRSSNACEEKNNSLTIEQIDIYECSCKAILIFTQSRSTFSKWSFRTSHLTFHFNAFNASLSPALAKFNVTFWKRNWWTQKLISIHLNWNVKNFIRHGNCIEIFHLVPFRIKDV